MTQPFWKGKRVIVTGGAGFLGRHVTARLERGGAEDIFVPRIEDYNLVDAGDIRRMYSEALRGGEAAQTTVIHLAANVGGIGANLASAF